MNANIYLTLNYYVIILTGALLFILSIISRIYKKKGVKWTKLLMKQTKGFLFNWMSIYLNSKGKKIIKVMNFLFIVFCIEILIMFIQIVYLLII